MKKKKIISLISLILLILIIIFLAFTIRKMIIIKDLMQKANKYVISDNYYKKTTNNINNTLQHTTELYRKENNLVIIVNIPETGVKSTSYFRRDKITTYNTYKESKTDKVAILDTKNTIVKDMNMEKIPNYNLWQLFQLAATSTIKSGEYREKTCYIAGSYNSSNKSYFEKETGLRIKDVLMNSEKGKVTELEYYYEFNNIDDSIFIEPDINQYKIQENI